MDDAITEDFLRDTSRVLHGAWGADIAIENPVVLKDGARCRVMRCAIANVPSGVASVIVKQIKGQPERGFDEWASLTFLSGLPNAQNIVPHFYGGDEVSRLFVIEDFGAGQTLDDLFMGNDKSAARAALGDLARQMARLHAATHGKQTDFDDLRAALPEDEGPQRFIEAERWRAGEDKIRHWCDAMNVALPPRFAAELDDIANVYREPSEWLLFSHGDPAPTNNHFAGGKARLLDFEYGAFRHALYDITAWQILCPLPIDAVSEMRCAFQEELTKTLPIARDEAQFAEAWAMLCAFRALALLTWITPESVQNGDHEWVGDWTARLAVFAAVSRLAHIAAPIARLDGIAEVANRLTDALRAQCADVDDVTPHWPALENA